MKICTVDGCEAEHKGLGYCDRHYQQFKKFGFIQGHPSKTKFDANDYVDKGPVCEIILHDAYRQELGRAIVDQADKDVLMPCKWHLTAQGYAECRKIKRTMGEFLLGIKTDRSTVIDHRNQNKLDYRRENLLVCGKSHNALNSKMRTDNQSGHRGVSWDCKREKWVAQLKINSAWVLHKRFDNVEDAIQAREVAFAKYALTLPK